MKKLIIFTAIVSIMTLAGFWSGRKLCTMSSMSCGVSAGQTLYSGMDLNDTQKKSVQNLEASFRKEADALCMQICRERVNLLQQIKNGSRNQEAVDKKVEEIGQLQISLEKKVIAHILEVNNALTSSQSVAYLERIYQQQCRMAAESGYGEKPDKK